jgi:hypothetical protein
VRLGRELLEKRRAAPARRFRAMRAASSRASTSPEFMLCTPTGAAWCAASPASQMPPLPRLRAKRHSNNASTSKSASVAPSTREPSRRSVARAAPSMPVPTNRERSGPANHRADLHAERAPRGPSSRRDRASHRNGQRCRARAAAGRPRRAAVNGYVAGSRDSPVASIVVRVSLRIRGWQNSTPCSSAARPRGGGAPLARAAQE